MRYGLEGLNGFCWHNPEGIGRVEYDCGYCGAYVGSGIGYNAIPDRREGVNDLDACAIAICPMCNCPTVFYWREDHRVQFPLPAPSRPVSHVPQDLASLYEEARVSAGAGAYTGAVLLCRKMLMNMAVAEGAVEGKPFAFYVEFLCDNGYVPPKGRPWVDYIRTRGNEATHEIRLVPREEALKLMAFVETLLRSNYEFPHIAGQ